MRWLDLSSGELVTFPARLAHRGSFPKVPTRRSQTRANTLVYSTSKGAACCLLSNIERGHLDTKNTARRRRSVNPPHPSARHRVQPIKYPHHPKQYPAMPLSVPCWSGTPTRRHGHRRSGMPSHMLGELSKVRFMSVSCLFHFQSTTPPKTNATTTHENAEHSRISPSPSIVPHSPLVRLIILWFWVRVPAVPILINRHHGSRTTLIS